MKKKNTVFFNFMSVVFMVLILSSCSRDNQIESLSFEIDQEGKAFLNLCFAEPFTYSNYLVKFKFESITGQIIETKETVWGDNSSYVDEGDKCRKLYSFNSIKGDHEQFEKNRQVFNDQMKSVSTELIYSGEVVSVNTFTFN